MRSRTPKVLHELCGRPMLLWPVHAALEAGARQVVVVDSPDRALEEVLPAGVELAVQPQSDGTGGAVVAAMSQIDSHAPVVVLSGDVPLVSADAIGGLMRAHAQSGRAGHDGEHGARRSERLRAGGARCGRRGGAGGGDQAGRGRHPGGARDPRGEHGHLRLRGGRAEGGAADASPRRTPRASCICRRCSTCSAPAANRWPPISSRRRAWCSGSTTAWRWRRCESSRSGRSTSGTCARG